MSFDTRQVIVTCDERYHEGNVVEVRTFKRVEGAWNLLNHSSDDDMLFNGDTPWTEDSGMTFGEFGDRRPRTRYRIECECGVSLIVRAVTLRGIFDPLVDHGVSSISLSRLNRLVSTWR